MADLTGSLEEGFWLDSWQHPDGTQVLLPSTNREQYARAGLTLIQEQAYDRRVQMAADADAYRFRDLREDTHPIPEGPTAYFPADG